MKRNLFEEIKKALNETVRDYTPRLKEKMHIDFERFVASEMNWPIERTGSSYHDERTAGAWEVFKFAKGA